MRRTAKRFGRRTIAQRHPTDLGTIKSIERQQGTGSIAPDRDAHVQADTGFTSAVVTDGDVTTLEVGDRVRFTADPMPDRPGYANATTVQAAGGNIAGQAITPMSSATSDTASRRPPGAVVSAATLAIENQETALASGEENPD